MGDQDKVKSMTEADFNKIVESRVHHIIAQKDAKITDMVKGIAREMITDPETLGSVVKAVNESQKSWNGKSNEQQLATMVRATESPEERLERKGLFLNKMFRGQPVSAKCAHLPVFSKYSPAPRVEIGTGELMTRALVYAFKSFDDGKRMDWLKIMDWAKVDRDDQLVEVIEEALAGKGFVGKDLQETDWSQGGGLLPAVLTVDFIAFLHGLSTLRQLGPVMLNPVTPELRFGRMSSTVSASWFGENETGNASTPGDDEINLSQKELEIKLIQSLRFLKAAPGGLLQMIQDDMRKAAKHAEETSLLTSTGSSNEPMGIKYLMDVTNRNVDRTQAGSISTVQEVIGDLLGMQERVYGSGGKVLPLRKAYIGQHRTRMGLMGIVDANDQPAIFAEMLSNDRLFDAQFGVTTNLAEDLDVDSSSDTDHTELFFVEMSEYILADWLDMEVREFDQATIKDENGNDYNLAERRAKALILSHSVDAALKHGKAACHLKNVDWGSDFINA